MPDTLNDALIELAKVGTVQTSYDPDSGYFCAVMAVDCSYYDGDYHPSPAAAIEVLRQRVQEAKV